MPNQYQTQLADYIQAMHDRSVPTAKIKTILLDTGWPEAMVDEQLARQSMPDRDWWINPPWPVGKKTWSGPMVKKLTKPKITPKQANASAPKFAAALVVPTAAKKLATPTTKAKPPTSSPTPAAVLTSASVSKLVEKTLAKPAKKQLVATAIKQVVAKRQPTTSLTDKLKSYRQQEAELEKIQIQGIWFGLGLCGVAILAIIWQVFVIK